MRSRIKSFHRDRSGVAAIEFALIGMCFVVMTCFWMELGLTMFMQTSLDNAVRNESRLIRTGAITAGGSAAFASKLCTDLQFIMSCPNIQYNVMSGASFASLSSAIATDSDSRLTTQQFNPGTSGQNVIVQVAYTRPIYSPIVASFLGKNGNLMVSSSIAFQNEPF